jgi:hypothetical protein
VNDSQRDACPAVEGVVTLPDEPGAGPGSALAQLRWHLAEAGFDGELIDQPRGKGLAELSSVPEPALVYVAGTAAIGALARVAHAWVRHRRKRIIIKIRRPDGSSEEYQFHDTGDARDIIRETRREKDRAVDE